MAESKTYTRGRDIPALGYCCASAAGLHMCNSPICARKLCNISHLMLVVRLYGCTAVVGVSDGSGVGGGHPQYVADWL